MVINITCLKIPGSGFISAAFKLILVVRSVVLVVVVLTLLTIYPAIYVVTICYLLKNSGY